MGPKCPYKDESTDRQSEYWLEYCTTFDNTTSYPHLLVPNALNGETSLNIMKTTEVLTVKFVCNISETVMGWPLVSMRVGVLYFPVISI